MQSPEECRQIVGVFQRRGMEFQEQRTSTANLESGRLAPATSSPSRPLTAHANSPYFDSSAPTSRSNPFTPQVLEEGNLSQPRLSGPERPPTEDNGPFRRANTASQDMLPPSEPFHRDDVAAPREVVPNRPSTAQIYRSYTTPSQPSQYQMPDPQSQPADVSGERPSSTSQMANVEAIRQAVEYDDPTHGVAGVPPQSAHASEHYSSATADPTNLALLSSDPGIPRPRTARPSTSATTAFPDTLEHEIPPRRELPFGRPESRQSGSASRPDTPSLSLPPLPKPKIARDGNGLPIYTSPVKDKSPARPATASPLKRSFIAVDQNEPPRPETAAAVAYQSPSHDQSQKRAQPLETSAFTNIPTRKLSPMNELLYGREPLAERSTNSKIPRLGSLADAPHEVVSPPSTTTFSPSKPPYRNDVESQAQTSSTINAYKACVQSPSRRRQDVSLEEYAAQSSEDREAALDEFMVANLENPAFTTLCEDVEKCWRRIALGL